jgi:hypothetical protein
VSILFMKTQSASGFRLAHIGSLFKALDFAVCCSECGANQFSLLEKDDKRSGLCSTLELSCLACTLSFTLTTSPLINMTAGGNSFEANRRVAFGALLMSTSRMDMARLTASLNIPPPSTQESWECHVSSILGAVNTVRHSTHSFRHINMCYTYGLSMNTLAILLRFTDEGKAY